jgi:hypothetical protein
VIAPNSTRPTSTPAMFSLLRIFPGMAKHMARLLHSFVKNILNTRNFSSG